MHWSSKWVGRPYIKKSFDCAELVREVVLCLRGIDVCLPADRDWRNATPRYLRSFAKDFAARTESPEDGDCVLMRYVGQRGEHGAHVGVYCKVAGGDWVLHNLEGLGVIFHPIRHLGKRLLKLEGFYRWT